MVNQLKLVVVGDGGVGKSCLLIASTTGNFPHAYVPTVFGSWVTDIHLNGQEYHMTAWDTAGQGKLLQYPGMFRLQEDYDRLRPLSYPGSDVIFLCFAVDNRDSFVNITEKWIPELQHHSPNVPKMLVACKTDLRHTGSGNYVTYEEGSKVAKDLGLRYQELSALTRVGMTTCFNTAIKEATKGLTARRRKKERLQFFRRIQREIPNPPSMPLAEKAPRVEVEPSRFVDDWQRMLEKPTYSDVTFVLEGGQRLDAHKLVLCSASSFFCQVFGVTQKNKTGKIEHLEPFSLDDMNSGLIKGITSAFDEGKVIREKGQRRHRITIKLAPDIKHSTFTSLLEFLYTGIPNLPEDHSCVSLDQVYEIVRVSKIFKMTRLNEICQNYIMEHDFLNPSIGTFLNAETGQKMKELFFNNPMHADVAFKVQGHTIYAHKVVLCARCRAMTTMFGYQFREGTEEMMEVGIPATSAKCFLALLEYIYTDQSPMEEAQVTSLIVLADRFNQKRLINMCELYATKEVERSVTKQIEHSEIDAIGLLLAAQMSNAHQLATWCLHFISSNYIAFKQRPDFKQIKGDNLEIVTKKQWPPLSYLEEVAEYKMKWTRNGIECSLM
ncbi:rho-related protein racA-like [Pecten maximus]|uniref:rho-related protein racA-like n=1 Tax=Pecten maximus TaxID=6579 RepID=UPI00145835E2|nr:rho-related protein racA-like [Pecten maximus]